MLVSVGQPISRTWTSIRAMRQRRINLHPVGSTMSRTIIPLHERHEIQEKRDPSTWRHHALSTAGHTPVPEIQRLPPSSTPDNGASRNHASLEISPERNDELSSDGDDRDLPDPTVQRAGPCAVPPRQRTLRLMSQP
jgi:hypothetical protein